MPPATRRGLFAAFLLLAPVNAGAVVLGAARPEPAPSEATPVVIRRRIRPVRVPRARPRAPRF